MIKYITFLVLVLLSANIAFSQDPKVKRWIKPNTGKDSVVAGTIWFDDGKGNHWHKEGYGKFRNSYVYKNNDITKGKEKSSLDDTHKYLNSNRVAIRKDSAKFITGFDTTYHRLKD